MHKPAQAHGPSDLILVKEKLDLEAIQQKCTLWLGGLHRGGKSGDLGDENDLRSFRLLAFIPERFELFSTKSLGEKLGPGFRTRELLKSKKGDLVRVDPRVAFAIAAQKKWPEEWDRQWVIHFDGALLRDERGRGFVACLACLNGAPKHTTRKLTSIREAHCLSLLYRPPP